MLTLCPTPSPSPASSELAGLGMGHRPRAVRHVQGDGEHVRAPVQALLRAVAVVHVPVDDRDALEPGADRGVAPPGPCSRTGSSRPWWPAAHGGRAGGRARRTACTRRPARPGSPPAPCRPPPATPATSPRTPGCSRPARRPRPGRTRRTSSTYAGSCRCTSSSISACRPSRQRSRPAIGPLRSAERMLRIRTSFSGCSSETSISGDGSCSNTPLPVSCSSTSSCQNTSRVGSATAGEPTWTAERRPGRPPSCAPSPASAAYRPCRRRAC